jgi:hypothetical protein
LAYSTPCHNADLTIFAWRVSETGRQSCDAGRSWEEEQGAGTLQRVGQSRYVTARRRRIARNPIRKALTIDIESISDLVE